MTRKRKKKKGAGKQIAAKRFLERLMQNRGEKMAYLFSALIVLALALAISPVQPEHGNLVGRLGEAVGAWLGKLFGLYAWLLLLALGALLVGRIKGLGSKQLALHGGAYACLGLAVVVLSGVFATRASLMGSCGVALAGAAEDWVGKTGMGIGSLLLGVFALYLLRLEHLLASQAKQALRRGLSGWERVLGLVARAGELARRMGREYVLKPWRELRGRKAAEKEVSGEKVSVREREMEQAMAREDREDVELTRGRNPSTRLRAGGETAMQANETGKPAAQVEEEEEEKAREVDGSGRRRKFRLPPLSLLEKPAVVDLSEHDPAEEEVLVDTLETFKVRATVVGRTLGPAVKRYELQPAPGTKTKSFTALRDEIALALQAKTVRVVAPIPGKAAVGIEVPRRNRQTVSFSGVLSSNSFRQREKGGLDFTVGLDMGGEPVVGDLTKMPHLLVAGSTNSGKSVCLHSILNSFLFTKTPDEMRLILIDPKRVELSFYKDIPHLIHPVIDDMRKAPGVLKWLVKEMDRRYKEFAAANVRNLDQHNENLEDGVAKMPYIVVVIDEISDLMMLAVREVEGIITRLSQMARGVGIHLVFATQNPVNDVVTGVIKANFPSRIAMKVANMVNSRTIIDVNGAEELLGQGDMLYCPADSPEAQRVMGCFLMKDEVKRVAKFWRNQGKPDYLEEIIDAAEGDGDNNAAGDDALLEEAIRVVLASGQASTSFIQRRLATGYSRAARLVDMMEREGIVGPSRGTKAREILVDPEEYLKDKDEG